MKPIYEPKGAAKEYGDYAINIYTGCPHGCFYCFAPSVLRRDREAFHSGDWSYEYAIFELVRLYKIFDWENNDLVLVGW